MHPPVDAEVGAFEGAMTLLLLQVSELPVPELDASGKARGEGDLVGEVAATRTDGEGVRARGERGILPHDFLLGEGKLVFLKVLTSLCFKPCNDDGR